MLDWGEVGILDPDPHYEPLAELVGELHSKFITAEREACKGNTAADLELFLRLLAEDNAHAVMHSLIGLGGLTNYRYGDRVASEDIAHEAFIEQRKLAGLASVSRPFAQSKIRPITPPDTRAADVVAYETALVTGEPMPRATIQTYFVDKSREVVSPYPQLAGGELSEAQMCSGFPPYNATYTLDSGNRSFFHGARDMLQVPSSLIRLDGPFSSTQAGVNLGIIIGLRTIYPAFPLVV